VGSNPTPSAMKDDFEAAMCQALLQARIAGENGDVPVGAVVVHNGKVIASRHNERELINDPTAHAEILALRDAANALGTWRLTECTLVVTLEPCVMCAGALMNARIGTLVYATADLKGGATASLYNVCSDPRLNHHPNVVLGVCENEANDLLKVFFSGKRLRGKIQSSGNQEDLPLGPE
jgi:tRNA(adenine34) deaminase